VNFAIEAANFTSFAELVGTMNPTDVQNLNIRTDGDRVDVQKSDNDPVSDSIRQERAATSPQIFRVRGELLQRRLQVVRNLPRDDLGRRKFGALLQAVVLQLEHVHVDLVAFDQLAGQRAETAGTYGDGRRVLFLTYEMARDSSDTG
jgi:hypothetical protein